MPFWKFQVFYKKTSVKHFSKLLDIQNGKNEDGPEQQKLLDMSIVQYIRYIIGGIRKQLYKVYFFIKPFLALFTRVLLGSEKNPPPMSIPIIINNRNRYSFLKLQIQSLKKRGYTNIYIIDNNSSYLPLLNYYDTECPYTVFRLKQNMGHLALWKSGIIKQFRSRYFVYTDSDVVLDECCPSDFMEQFIRVMMKYPLVEKVGFSLRIDNLPDCYDQKQQVIDWESQFYKRKISDNPPLYKATIDTTFALYRPYSKSGWNLHSPIIRIGEPYIARHMPWYNDSAKLEEEELFYIQHCETLTGWTMKK